MSHLDHSAATRGLACPAGRQKFVLHGSGVLFLIFGCAAINHKDSGSIFVYLGLIFFFLYLKDASFIGKADCEGTSSYVRVHVPQGQELRLA